LVLVVLEVLEQALSEATVLIQRFLVVGLLQLSLLQAAVAALHITVLQQALTVALVEVIPAIILEQLVKHHLQGKEVTAVLAEHMAAAVAAALAALVAMAHQQTAATVVQVLHMGVIHMQAGAAARLTAELQ
jgi:hypothetical protein